ncbi:RHE_PE00001 family protein [Shinella zoogloeoides]|uniref:RHE_PE00001 family protein n=1 Tax=Shinella zoogloeoides TaxID=352475 RepID=UPI0028B0A749|nr:RHE_PE00001 family protein [Shinella zoogloeoides]
MNSMRYDLAKLPIQRLLQPLSDAGVALARLDERVARSPVGQGWIGRMHFADACASLWVDGELVHVEDLVLHDAAHDIRAPTHELTIASDVLRTRRRIAAQPADWALSTQGLNGLCRAGAADEKDLSGHDGGDAAAMERGNDDVGEDVLDPLASELAAIDALLARSEAVIAETKASGRVREREALVYEADWDEDARLEEWRTVLAEIGSLPPVLQAVLALDAWNVLGVLQHGAWLGRQLAGGILRQCALTTGAHLVAFNLGLKSIPVDRRRHVDRDVRLSAMLHALGAAAELGLKEHDRLTLARTMMERKLVGRRTSSNLPGLIELVLARPMVSAGMVAGALDVTPQAALRIIRELGLREMTGRGRFRAWGVI